MLNVESKQKKRVILARGEWISLAGVVLAALSPALVWQNRRPAVIGPAGALYISSHNYSRTGFDLSIGFVHVGILIVVCALVCVAMLLFEPPARKKPKYFIVQVVC